MNGKFLIPIDKILRISKYSGLTLSDIESSIIAIGSAQGSLQIKIRLPLKFTEDLAYLTGIVITDGHINKDFLWVQFVSNEEKLGDLFMEKTRRVFNHSNFYLNPKNPTVIYAKNKTIAKIISMLGVPEGKKSHKVSIPKYIFHCKKSIIKSFLRGCFDGDGSVAYTPWQGFRIINYATSSERMAEGITKLLSYFDIKGSLTKNLNNVYYVNITGRKNIEKFRDEIGFNHPKRSEKLEFVVDSYKNPA